MNLEIKWLRFASVMSSAVIVKVLLIAGGYLGGKELDAMWGTDPYLSVLGLILGAALGLTWILWVLQKRKPSP